MIGAVIGDVVGSRFEFNNIKTKEFELISKESQFTDDTVLTIAVMDWLLHAETKDSASAAEYLKKWARKYPYAGYGSRFIHWKDKYASAPYNSCGNGSAMRVSGVGWVSDNPETVKLLSDTITGVTHNHPEGMKGAYVTAELIRMARTGASKEEMKSFAKKYYNLDFDYDDLVRNYCHGAEICQETVPQALYCFFISDSFEDCLRTTISIGGDCDTTAAISCAVAEAFYGEIPKSLVDNVINKLPDDLIKIIEEFNKVFPNSTSYHLDEQKEG